MPSFAAGSTKVLSAMGRNSPILSRRSDSSGQLPLHETCPIVTTNANRRLVKGGIVFLDLHREEGQGLAEYGLIISIIAVAAVLALLFVSGTINTLLSSIGQAL
jgi:pilus assembly protein Flp/PilA